MPMLEIDIPEQTLDRLDIEPHECVVAMKTIAALKRYALGRPSSHEARCLGLREEDI